MKKLYSAIYVLAMMFAALSLSACGGDDEDDDFGGVDAPSIYEFAITYDGETKEYEAGYQEAHSEGIIWDKDKHYFYLGLMKPYGNVIIKFPSSVEASDFKSGNKFVGYEFQWTSYAGGIYAFDGDYIDGSATVKSNDGKTIVVRFSNFSFNLSSYEVSKTHTMTIDGTIRFAIY
jgi:hypothetical protein